MRTALRRVLLPAAPRAVQATDGHSKGNDQTNPIPRNRHQSTGFHLSARRIGGALFRRAWRSVVHGLPIGAWGGGQRAATRPVALTNPKTGVRTAPRRVLLPAAPGQFRQRTGTAREMTKRTQFLVTAINPLASTSPLGGLEVRFSEGLGDRSSTGYRSGHGVGANRPPRGRSSSLPTKPALSPSSPSVLVFSTFIHYQSQQFRPNEINHIRAFELRAPLASV